MSWCKRRGQNADACYVGRETLATVKQNGSIIERHTGFCLRINRTRIFVIFKVRAFLYLWF